jgi:hypothetical protein
LSWVQRLDPGEKALSELLLMRIQMVVVAAVT